MPFQITPPAGICQCFITSLITKKHLTRWIVFIQACATRLKGSIDDCQQVPPIHQSGTFNPVDDFFIIANLLFIFPSALGGLEPERPPGPDIGNCG